MNHATYPKSLRRKSNDELHYIIRDCRETLAAMPDSPKAGHYQDEILYAAAELARRAK